MNTQLLRAGGVLAILATCTMVPVELVRAHGNEARYVEKLTSSLASPARSTDKP